MPTASSSRRRISSRRRASSEIEEDPREEQSTRVSRNPKNKEKGKAPQREVYDTVESGESDSDNNEVIDVNNFQNQPLNRNDVQRLRGYVSDWNNMASKIRQSWTVVGETASAMAETTTGSERDRGLEELNKVMKDLLDIDAEMQFHSQFLDATHQKVAQGAEIDDIVDAYTEYIETRKKDYKGKTMRQKYAKTEGYIKFRQSIYEVLEPDTAMPPITDFIPKEDGDVSDDEDDLEIGGVTQNYNCPISLTPLADPLTSSVCGHSFSAEPLRQTFKTGSPMKKCPASGCNRSFKLADCKPNPELARKVRAWMRRTQRVEDDSDADEVVD
ncbi:hypothetical protein AX16_005355 [Volvariella volvacea WC 439]|nr:hypothetical protein AX16_005355 [Volvariella volvacea WC 439]